MSSSYIRQILGQDTATVIYENDVYGKTTADTFTNSFSQQGGNLNSLPQQDGNIAPSYPLDQNPTQPDLDYVATTVAQSTNSGIIYVAALDELTAKVIMALRRHGVTAPIFCTTAVSTSHFVDLFASEPEERRQPGYFTDHVYAPAPAIFDSAPDAAQAFATRYQKTYGHAPSWPGAMFYESAQVAIEALKRAKVEGTPASLISDRAQIVQQLQAMTSLQKSAETIGGPVYFGKDRNAVLPLRFGWFLHRQFHSLPIQLVPVSSTDSADLTQQESAGEIIQADNQYVWKQRVVYTGIALNKVNAIDMTTGTFSADFYLWMRYAGNDDVTSIEFTDASNVSFDPTTPLESRTTPDGLHYRLYHVTGTFRADYDLHQYPFDSQQLKIRFQNSHLTSEHLVYAIDAQGLQLCSDNTLDYSTGISAFQSLSSWVYITTQYASDTFTSHSTLGNPQNFDQRTQTDYSGLQVTMTIQRKSLAYLTSHLLPLVLLFLLVYASLFLPHDEHLGDRLALVVAALLAGAVLLLSINGELPEIGYVVSLHYIYYIFFALCFICIVVPMFMKSLEAQKHPHLLRYAQKRPHLLRYAQKHPHLLRYVQKRPHLLRWINIALHIFYLLIIAVTIIYYYNIYNDAQSLYMMMRCHCIAI
jgi:hypothetical protein